MLDRRDFIEMRPNNSNDYPPELEEMNSVPVTVVWNSRNVIWEYFRQQRPGL